MVDLVLEAYNLNLEFRQNGVDQIGLWFVAHAVMSSFVLGSFANITRQESVDWKDIQSMVSM